MVAGVPVSFYDVSEEDQGRMSEAEKQAYDELYATKAWGAE